MGIPYFTSMKNIHPATTDITDSATKMTANTIPAKNTKRLVKNVRADKGDSFSFSLNYTNARHSVKQGNSAFTLPTPNTMMLSRKNSRC